MEKELQKELLLNEYRKDARRLALNRAFDLQPNYLGMQPNNLNNGKKSVENILADADKIYEWLVEPIN